jgi:hypothetical protein
VTVSLPVVTSVTTLSTTITQDHYESPPLATSPVAFLTMAVGRPPTRSKSTPSLPSRTPPTPPL